MMRSSANGILSPRIPISDFQEKRRLKPKHLQIIEMKVKIYHLTCYAEILMEIQSDEG